VGKIENKTRNKTIRKNEKTGFLNETEKEKQNSLEETE
jgi:hypothetical protein